MNAELEKIMKEYMSLSPQGKLEYHYNMVDELVELMKNKETNIIEFSNRVAILKALLSSLFRVTGAYRKEYFEYLCYAIQKFWYGVEECNSQKLRYPALSCFTDFFSNLKGLNPYYTLEATLKGIIRYGQLPSMKELEELLKKEKLHLMFLLDYMQLESIMKFELNETEKAIIIKSAINFIQMLILTIYNFLVTIPILPIEEFKGWANVLDTAITKAQESIKYLYKTEKTIIQETSVKILESSLFTLRCQLNHLRIKYLETNISTSLEKTYFDISMSLQNFQKMYTDENNKAEIEKYYYQQKTLLLETRFYQILQNYVKVQYKGEKYVENIKDDKLELSLANKKFEINEILREIEVYTIKLLENQQTSDLGISANLISIYAKIAFGAYVYGLFEEIPKMETLTRIRRLDMSDPDLPLLIGKYWLMKWATEEKKEFLQLAKNYYERAAEIFDIAFNNKFVPIYCYSLLSILELNDKNDSKADMYLLKVDDAFADLKVLNLLNKNQIHYHSLFREQLDRIIETGMNNEEIKPLRFNTNFNPIDFNTWQSEKRDWRKKISHLPEPYPFHVSRNKIHEYQ